MQADDRGEGARERLIRAPGVSKAAVDGVDLFVLRDALSASCCEALIALIDARRSPSRLFADNPDPGFRTSETCNLDPADPAVREVEKLLEALLDLRAAHGERLQGQRYAPGQQFKAHHDYLRVGAGYWPRQQLLGGQRTWTAMIFLDVPEQGGETRFPLLDVTVPPRRGSLVVWNNLDGEGQPNPLTLHQGLPVVSGVKHIVTKWWRERPWGAATA